MKFTFVGDCMVQEKFELNNPSMDEIKAFLSKGDLRFFNLETTVNPMGSCPGSQFSGGSYLRTDEEALLSVMNFGFNMTSFNNNHAFDFTTDGFVATDNALKKHGIPFAGTGMDLEEASAAADFSQNGESVGLISVCSSFSPSMMAGNSSPCFAGRPGINGLRIETTLMAAKEQLDSLKILAEESGINAADDLDRAQGYLLPLAPNELSFNGLKVVLGDKNKVFYHYNADDAQRIKESILRAKQKNDYVIVSLHTHEMAGMDPQIVPEVIEEFCHFCIDNGADALVGHGPHLLRGIEIYRNRPIFYSVGNFIMQLNSIPEAPADFYEKYGVSPEEGIGKLLDVRSAGGKRGLMYMPEMFEAIVPYFEFVGGKLVRAEFLPIELGFDETDRTRGLPRAVENPTFFARLQELSKKYNTVIKYENGIGVIEL